MNDHPDKLLTAEEVGHRLRLKPATIYEAAADGRIPCVRLWKGRRKALIRFRREDIEGFLDERSAPASKQGDSASPSQTP